MSKGLEEDVAYRLVYDAARTIVEPATPGFRQFSPGNRRDVAALRVRTVQALGADAEGIDPVIVAEAVDDVIRGRPPRW